VYESEGLFIDGRWRKSADGATFSVFDPATEEPLGLIPDATRADLDDALHGAERAFHAWRQVPGHERGARLRAIADRIRESAEEIACQITREMGKTLTEAKAEVSATADQFEWQGEEAKRIFGQILDGRTPEATYSVRYEPVGVVAAFTPWNFPALLPARKIAAALAAGCSVVIKPSEEAPGATFALARIADEVGLPSGTLQVVTGEPAKISQHLISAVSVRKITFTGSVPVGKHLMQLAALGIKKVSFELGGHAPVLVFEDVDPERAGEACARGKFRNAGQVCISPSRFFVHGSIAAPFSEAFAAVARGLRVGNGLEPSVEMGPLANHRRLEAARVLVDDALSRGATRLAGNERTDLPERGYFFPPTVLSDVPPDARILHEEPFVPVGPILVFDDLEEVIERANAVPYGLAAYVFTDHLRTARLASEALEVGMVGINDFGIAAAEAPFGGVKESGIGRESGTLGIHEFLEPKTVKTVI
jgi:succinate-semialdehyde dehydrogenase/glutarate-semialdehyde dehydrogenase